MRRAELYKWALATAVALVLHTTWLWPGIRSGGFQNQDVAGIAYNAHLILDGKVPYIDSLEVKSPAAFLLFAAVFATGGGMSAVWVFGVLWGTLTSLGVGQLVLRLWGRRWAPAAVMMHAAGAFAASLGDINYSFFMMAPFIWAAALSVPDCAAHQVVTASRATERAPDIRRRWLCVGLFAGLAFAFKHNAVALGLPVLYGVWQTGDERRRALGMLALGAAVSALVIALPFAALGAPHALYVAAATSRTFGGQYVATATDASGGTLPLLFHELDCHLRTFALPYLLAVLGLLPIAPAHDRVAMRNAGVLAIASVMGLALTLRFYPHDFVIVWPALIALGLRTGGFIAEHTRAIRHPRTSEYLPMIVGLALGLAVTGGNWRRANALRDELLRSDAVVAQICSASIGALPKNEPVLGWGWSAWSVYHHCQRFAPGPIYKELGVVTSANTNTCSDPFGRPIRWRPGPTADAYLAALRAHPPSLVLLSPYYRTIGDGRDPLADWDALRGELEQHYVVLPAPRGFSVLLRRDIAARIQ